MSDALMSSVSRAIFVYLSSTDLSKINFNRVEPDSPEEMLMNLKDARTTYARVYETLCRSAFPIVNIRHIYKVFV